MPWGIQTALNFQHYTGYPFRPTQVFTGLNQGSVTVALEPQGTLRLPSVNMADLRYIPAVPPWGTLEVGTHRRPV